MNLLFRFLRILLSALLARKRTSLLDPHTIRSAVWIGDQDLMGHMTNSRYSSFTDLAIMNYITRTGALGVFRKNGWLPIIQHESLTFHRMMRYPQKFEVETRLAGWEDSHFCFFHTFRSDGRVIAESRMISRLAGRKKAKVTVDMTMQALGVHLESPPLDAPFRAALDTLLVRK